MKNAGGADRVVFEAQELCLLLPKANQPFEQRDILRHALRFLRSVNDSSSCIDSAFFLLPLSVPRQQSDSKFAHH
jgi:hypothetical protein